MNTQKLTENILELIRRTSCFIPPDAQEILEIRKKLEEGGSRADFAMDLILQNIQLAKRNSRPICQDTGYLTFYIKIPVDFNPLILREAIETGVLEATRKGYLRQNSVDSLTGKNTGTNLGAGTPAIHYEFHDSDKMDIRLIQKGGGCENMSSQYSLPESFLDKHFGRDLDGVRACILDALNNAQGKGCAPGFLGVCIGGDRATGFEWAKHQFLRDLNDVNPDPKLAALEAQIIEEANQLEIGPVGFGGKMTIGSCKIGIRNRLPASYYVTIAYMCWAFRRRGVVLDQNCDVVEWLYHGPGEFEKPLDIADSFTVSAKNVVHLHTPVTEDQIRSLNVGDVVLIHGTVYTGRDAVHKYLHEGGELDMIKNGIIYHCGPVMLKEGDSYKTMAAGPTTSIREEPYQHQVIQKFGIKAVIGKGGMGPRTLEACQKYGSVYLHAIGGAAQIYAKCVKKVVSVHLEQFGSPEAVWELAVDGFPAVVTMDSHGQSLHRDLKVVSDEKFRNLL